MELHYNKQFSALICVHGGSFCTHPVLMVYSWCTHPVLKDANELILWVLMY